MDHNMFKRASDIIASCEEGYFSYIDKSGFPHTATRSKIKSHSISTCYFSTNLSGNMATALLKDSRAGICFRQDNNNITLTGTATVITDPNIKQDMWLDWFINHYPGGPTDPDYCIIKFETKYLSLWIDYKIAESSIESLNNITSRCGLLCQTCEWKEPYNCNGCIASMGNPFHGECPIAQCAQAKGFIHCGQCLDMPCQKLHEYSCGDSEHCDSPKGARLEILKMWKDVQ